MTIPPLFAATPLDPIAPALFWGMAGVMGLLIAGSLAAFALPMLQPGKDHAELGQRMSSWWVMAALVGAALVFGWPATLGLFVVISFVALREFLSLAPLRREDRLVIFLAYLVIPANYALLAANRYGIYLVFIPVWAFLIAPFILAAIGQTRAYLSTAATFHWGLMTCVYNLGFAAFLARTPLSQMP
jgi:phosphatidate cytidylyltransferase